MEFPQLNALLEWAAIASRELGPRVGRWTSWMEHGARELTREALGQDFEARVEFLRNRYGGPEGDAFGLVPDAACDALRPLALLHRFWFRTEVFGMSHVPEGRVLLVANHSGQIPLDACMLATTLFLDRQPPRVVRSMVEKWTQTVPLVSEFLSRTGQVVGMPGNCLRLLENEECILVFPEGVRGVAKPFSRRYQLESFGTGFVRMALQAHAPVVPVGVIGAEEQYVSLGNLGSLARFLHLPAFPLVPQLLIPGGQLPLPARYRIHFGEPLQLSGDPDDEAGVREQMLRVRQAVEALVHKGLRERRGVFR